MNNINIMQLREELLESVDILIMARLKRFKYNRTEYGLVTEDKGNNLYSVKINGSFSDIYSVNNPIINVGDVVIIIICNNNYSTNKYIWGKRPPDVI